MKKWPPRTGFVPLISYNRLLEQGAYVALGDDRLTVACVLGDDGDERLVVVIANSDEVAPREVARSAAYLPCAEKTSQAWQALHQAKLDEQLASNAGDAAALEKSRARVVELARKLPATGVERNSRHHGLVTPLEMSYCKAVVHEWADRDPPANRPAFWKLLPATATRPHAHVLASLLQRSGPLAASQISLVTGLATELVRESLEFLVSNSLVQRMADAGGRYVGCIGALQQPTQSTPAARPEAPAAPADATCPDFSGWVRELMEVRGGMRHALRMANDIRGILADKRRIDFGTRRVLLDHIARTSETIEQLLRQAHDGTGRLVVTLADAIDDQRTRDALIDACELENALVPDGAYAPG